jgi:hypothetical protein
LLTHSSLSISLRPMRMTPLPLIVSEKPTLCFTAFFSSCRAPHQVEGMRFLEL